MAVNKPTITAGPSIKRGEVVDQRVQTHPAGPGQSYIVRNPGTAPTTITVGPPTRAGQIFFEVRKDGLNRLALMYVGAEIDGALVWVPLSPESTVNGYTGRPIDPIYDQ